MSQPKPNGEGISGRSGREEKKQDLIADYKLFITSATNSLND